MKYKLNQYKTLTEDQRKEYFFERQAVCKDFVLDIEGRCARRIEIKDRGVHFCDYVRSEEMHDDHFICEFSEEYRKKILRGL